MQGVDPRSSLNYCWDFPSAVNKRIQIIVNNQSRNIDIMEMGDLMPFKFPVRNCRLFQLELVLTTSYVDFLWLQGRIT
jgi:hypothetical protein